MSDSARLERIERSLYNLKQVVYCAIGGAIGLYIRYLLGWM